MTYQEAIETLERDGIEKKLAGKDFNIESYCQYRGQAVWDLLKSLNVSEEDLKSLNIIHVAGSKGKGSTCSFIESILRNSGVKVGLFTSPQMIDHTERIRINGQNISKECFGQLFHQLWSEEGRLICQEYDSSCFFLVFLCMAIRAFIYNQVDVAIIEVGRGGEYDLTNIIPNPTVCAITYLEIEHAEALGNDIRSIAWHKSGILKPGCTAFTWPQATNAMDVLRARAGEKNCHLFVIPDFSQYVADNNEDIKLGLVGKHQEMNASLAIQVSKYWLLKMKKMDQPMDDSNIITEYRISNNFLRGLQQVNLLGRQQVVKRESITFYLDVAHTKASVEAAANWFQDSTTLEERKLQKKCSRILVLTINGIRNYNDLLPSLKKVKFDYIAFTPSVVFSDNMNDNKSWTGNVQSDFVAYAENTEKAWRDIDGSTDEIAYKKFLNINQAMGWITKGKDDELHHRATKFLDPNSNLEEASWTEEHLQILAIGSFRVVKGFLSLFNHTN